MLTPTGRVPTIRTDALLDLCDWLLRQFKRTGSSSFRGHTSAYIVYFPNGTYAVNDTIGHRGPPWLRDNGHEDLSQLRFYGQARGRHRPACRQDAATFQDKANPKAILAFTKHTHNNSISTNVLQDMTVNGGAGNPCRGHRLPGANLATVRNVTVASDDGQGYAGLRLPIWPTQGLYSDITVVGFDLGIDVVGGLVANGPAFENITLCGQRMCGFRVQNSVTPIRNLYVQDPRGRPSG